MARGFFPDSRFFDETGQLYPFDLRYDPDDKAFCSPRPDGSVLFRLIAEAGFRDAHLVLGDGTAYPMEQWAHTTRNTYWQIALPPRGRRLDYTFALRDRQGRAVYLVPAGIGNAVERLDRFHLDLDTATPLDPPEWMRGAVIYQIFPERFRSGEPDLTPADADAWGSEPHWLRFQGGDLVGIAEEADYLADLGVDVVYLNPIFHSPSTHRYDAIDYHTVDPALGGNDAMRTLVESLHTRGIKLVVDTSFNHCSPRFFAFADLVANGPESEYRDWFVVHDWPPRVKLRSHVGGEAWVTSAAYQSYLATLTETDGVTVERATDDGPAVETTYEAWYGVPSLPRLNLANPDTRSYFLDVAAHWLREFDIDGWRMDVARYVDFDFWPEFRRVTKEAKPDAYLIAEIMGDASPWLQGDTFDATMDYTFRQLCLDYFATAVCDAETFADGIIRWLAMYSPDATAVNQNLISSHDTARFRHEAGGDLGRVAAAVLFQLTMPGAPGIYYGDEIGMTGGDDPGSRGAFPWDDPGSWDRELLGMTRTLAALRRRHPALRLGTWRLASTGGNGISYVREHDGERIAVVIGEATDPSPTVLWRGTAGGVFLL